MELDEINKALTARFIGPEPPPGAVLKPVDWFGTGENVGDFSLREGEDGEPVLMLTVDKKYLEDSWKVWNTPISK